MPSCRHNLRLINNLGSLLRKQGDLAGVRAAHERALAILERRLGLEHPRARSVRENLDELGQLQVRATISLAGNTTAVGWSGARGRQRQRWR